VTRRTLNEAAAAAAAVATLAVAAPASAAPIDFFQFDAGRDTATVVLVKALRYSAENPAPPLLTAVYTDFSTGQTGSVGYTHRWAVSPAGPHGLVLGLGAAASTYRNEERPSEDETKAALRGQAEAYGPAPGGGYYALLQASTFRSAWLGLLQYSPAGWPVGIEVMRQYQEGYQATTTALRFNPGIDRWYLRAGVVRTSEEYRPFVGITFNAF
jgi:hypothetical protein